MYLLSLVEVFLVALLTLFNFKKSQRKKKFRIEIPIGNHGALLKRGTSKYILN